MSRFFIRSCARRLLVGGEGLGKVFPCSLPYGILRIARQKEGERDETTSRRDDSGPLDPWGRNRAQCFKSPCFCIFESNGTVGKKGRQVQVTVLLSCDRTQNARLRVTVTQGSGKAAVAQKRKKVSCTTAEGHFPLRAKARGKHRFTAGQATACALAVMNDDVTQWCKDVTLVAAPKG